MKLRRAGRALLQKRLVILQPAGRIFDRSPGDLLGGVGFCQDVASPLRVNALHPSEHAGPVESCVLEKDQLRLVVAGRGQEGDQLNALCFGRVGMSRQREDDRMDLFHSLVAAVNQNGQFVTTYDPALTEGFSSTQSFITTLTDPADGQGFFIGEDPTPPGGATAYGQAVGPGTELVASAANPVPEPSALLLLGSALFVLVGLRSRRFLGDKPS